MSCCEKRPQPSSTWERASERAREAENGACPQLHQHARKHIFAEMHSCTVHMLLLSMLTIECMHALHTYPRKRRNVSAKQHNAESTPPRTQTQSRDNALVHRAHVLPSMLTIECMHACSSHISHKKHCTRTLRARANNRTGQKCRIQIYARRRFHFPQHTSRCSVAPFKSAMNKR